MIIIPTFRTAGDGIHELRIHIGAGWRVYFALRAGQVVVLLAGGSKRTGSCRTQNP
ncbi:type II toxin-antitoxin system RelE/ParE family toxin [Acidiferrobacter sp. SPIII_3]|uniref:type II toxin-antitoxin system RelE/ParE family toxin n=1 Tax=Acidiferrobacter sp. SPIII_3 TaxID=1281578 RepID=UPI00351AAB06